MAVPGGDFTASEEPGDEGGPVLFWLCRVEIITEHGQDVQMVSVSLFNVCVWFSVLIECTVLQWYLVYKDHCDYFLFPIHLV